MPADLWLNLRDLFNEQIQGLETELEIHIYDVPADAMQTLLLDLMQRSEYVQTAFQRIDFPVPVEAASPQAATYALSSGQIVGAISLKLRAMPEIGLYFDMARRMSIAYMPAPFWTPLALITLFNLLVEIRARCPHATIQPDDVCFTPDEQQRFEEQLQQYAPNIA